MPRRRSQSEEWTTAQVADFLGYRPDAGNPDVSLAKARKWLTRNEIAAVGRDVETGQKLWPADLVRAKREAWDGRGRRTDLEQT